jgi:hypothetical protein
LGYVVAPGHPAGLAQQFQDRRSLEVALRFPRDAEFTIKARIEAQ